MPKTYFWFPSPSATRVITVEERYRRWKPELAQSEIDWAHPLARGLVAYWDFGQAGRGRALDLGPYAAHGTADVAASFPVGVSPVGPCIAKGNNWNNEIVVAEQAAFQTGAMSADFFVKRGGTVTEAICRHYSTTGKWQQISFGATNITASRDDGSVWHTATVAWSNNWDHWAFTDPNDGSTPLRLYQNGALVASAGVTTALNYSGHTFSLHQFMTEYPYGDMAYYRQWNRALTAAEILQLYVEPFCFLKPRRQLVFVGGAGPPAAKKRRLALLGVGR